MTKKEHIDLLVRISAKLRRYYDKAILGGGELWDNCRDAQDIAAAIKSLHQSEPTTLTVIDAYDLIIQRMKARGEAEFKRYDARVAVLIRRGILLDVAMAESMAFEDVLGGFKAPDGFDLLTAHMQSAYTLGRTMAERAFK